MKINKNLVKNTLEFISLYLALTLFFSIAWFLRKTSSSSTIIDLYVYITMIIQNITSIDDLLFYSYIRNGVVGPLLLSLLIITFKHLIKVFINQGINGVKPNMLMIASDAVVINCNARFDKVFRLCKRIKEKSLIAMVFLKKGAAGVLQTIHGAYICSIKILSKAIQSIYLYILLLFIAVVSFSYQVNIMTYILSKFGRDYFTLNYIRPDVSKIRVGKDNRTKNLIMIYVESLENTYSNEKIFGRNLLDPLNQVQLNGTSFLNFWQAPGTGWTIAGIVSSQCGIPLLTAGKGVNNDDIFYTNKAKNQLIGRLDGNQLFENVKTFLPNAICLGDILNAKGYVNVFMGGASLNFAGKGKFFKNHGYQELYGKEEWAERGLVIPEGWGIRDDVLFEEALKKLEKLRLQNNFYNLTILTVDTHHVDGHVSETCKSKSVVKFEDIVSCSVNTLAEFIKEVDNRGYLNDTNIVIIGDHLSMVNNIYNKIVLEKNRTIFNRFISKDAITPNRSELVHFDLFPTIIEFIGFDIQGHRLGLGYSGISEYDIDYPINRHDEIVSDLMNTSPTYYKLWNTQNR